MADKEEEEDLPWDRERPPLEGDMPWVRDPEQGSQPDHAPLPPPTPFLMQECPKCKSSNIRFANDLSLWCLAGCNEWFTAAISEEEAIAHFDYAPGPDEPEPP